jgi:hypothetical protein
MAFSLSLKLRLRDHALAHLQEMEVHLGEQLCGLFVGHGGFP